MKIAIISKTDSSGGGASRVAAELAVQLNSYEDIIAHHWTGHSGKNKSLMQRNLHGGSLLQTAHKGFRLLSSLVGFPDFLTPELLIHLITKNFEYDIYHIHDISTTLSPLAVSWLSRRKPMVWTFHDCSPFTGGCLYPQGCGNYLSGCHDCPQLHEWPMFAGPDFTGKIQNYKHRMLADNQIRIIAPSSWMADEAVRSGACRLRPTVVPYCVNTDIFFCYEKSMVRNELGLPVDKNIVLLSAWSLRDKRKGLMYAMEALAKFKRSPFILMIGEEDQETKKGFSGADIYFAGRIVDDQKLAKYYAAADVFMFPTLADNLPNVVLETMSCGTPCVAFDSGGVGEMIDADVTGYIVKKYDSGMMAERTQLLLDKVDLRLNMAAKGREKVIREYNSRLFVDRHVRIYRDILDQRRGAVL